MVSEKTGRKAAQAAGGHACRPAEDLAGFAAEPAKATMPGGLLVLVNRYRCPGESQVTVSVV